VRLHPRIAVFALLLACIAWYFWTQPPEPWTWMQTVGVCMMIIGFPLWLLAHIQLGSSFSVSAQARKLITTGLYSKIRSPIYVFGLIGVAGGLLMAGYPKFLLIFVVLIPLQIVRTRREARVLEEKFGEEYREYRRRAWF
jgi:protein-S-isoprenylcysteine O-methyltransferase Ste14